MQPFPHTIRLGILVTVCLAISACETMASFYDEVIVASVSETIVEPVKDTDLSYCYGCDWIVQEYHLKWETHNSKPYDTEEECLRAKREQRDRDPERLFRCIHESDLL